MPKVVWREDAKRQLRDIAVLDGRRDMAALLETFDDNKEDY